MATGTTSMRTWARSPRCRSSVEACDGGFVGAPSGRAVRICRADNRQTIEELSMKKLIAAVLAALVLPTVAQAAATTATAPFQADVKACNGDTIRLSGQRLGVFTATANAAGGVALS